MTDKNFAPQLNELKEKIDKALASAYSLVRNNHPMNHNCLIILNDYEAKVSRAIRKLFAEKTGK